MIHQLILQALYLLKVSGNVFTSRKWFFFPFFRILLRLPLTTTIKIFDTSDKGYDVIWFKMARYYY